jgi:protein-L-isoaspartate(D-aspartate) O-methyltransferase
MFALIITRISSIKINELDDRNLMMLLQLRQNGILDDRIYDAISSFSKEDFLPKSLKGFAKEDLNFKIFNNIFASKTSDIARMIFLGLSLNDKVRNVLEIGTGSGWQTALLSNIYNRVYTIEINKESYLFSRNILKNISNKIAYKHGDGKLGWLDAGPFDAIYIDCCIEDEPYYLYSNLVKDEGVLITANNYDNKQYYCSCLPHSGKGLVKSVYEVNRTILL